MLENHKTYVNKLFTLFRILVPLSPSVLFKYSVKYKVMDIYQILIILQIYKIVMHLSLIFGEPRILDTCPAKTKARTTLGYKGEVLPKT